MKISDVQEPSMNPLHLILKASKLPSHHDLSRQQVYNILQLVNYSFTNLIDPFLRTDDF